MLRELCVFLSVLTILVIAAPQKSYESKAVAAPCDPAKCKLPSCRCASTTIPGDLDAKKIPQIVLLTFDDAITTVSYAFYEKVLLGRKNPDGCPIGATFFLSHEYTDYSLVNDLYGRGHEIALHSITHQTITDYWKNMPVSELKKEFSGERDLVSEFGKIPKDSIQGIRMPFLQLAGNNSFQMLKEEKFTYDCSMPTQKYLQPGIWPYTLDYASTQDCIIQPCPNEAIPGVWTIPMIDWLDDNDVFCAMVDACQNVPDNVDGLVELMKKNFLKQYNGNRAPFGFYTHAAWFAGDAKRFEAYKKFVDYLQTLKDVYLVGANRLIDWVKNPKPIDNLKDVWTKCQPAPGSTCPSPKVCVYTVNGMERRMTVCTDNCPPNYPWLGNPLGK